MSGAAIRECCSRRSSMVAATSAACGQARSTCPASSASERRRSCASRRWRLKASGAGDDVAHSSIRFGLGRWTTREEVDYVADKLSQVVTRLREMSPLYELAKEGVDLSTMQWQVD